MYLLGYYLFENKIAKNVYSQIIGKCSLKPLVIRNAMIGINFTTSAEFSRI